VIRPVISTEAKAAGLSRLALSCALLAIIIAPAALGISAIVHRGLSSEAVTAALVAGSLCWLAAALALVATYIGNSLHAPVQGLLVSMLVRMGLPLAALVVLPKLGGSVGSSGVTSTIMGVYLVALAVETGLALKMATSRPAAAAIKA
jgi:hypothetical protein